MSISLEASVQYGDMSGTAALDDGDFESLRKILGLPGKWHLVGISIFSTHPSLGVEGKDHADTSYTGATAWALDEALLVPGKGIPGLFETTSPVDVAEFTFATGDNVYPSTDDAVSILLRGAKRLSIVLWHRAIPRPMTPRMMRVTSEHSMVRVDGHWVEEPAE